MKLLDRYILKEMSGPFLFGILAFTVILVAGNLLFKIAELLIQRGVSLGTVTRLFLYSLPGVVVLTIPMSSLLAALLGFGRLSANVEIVALKAAGIPFERAVRPVLAAAVVVSIAAFALNETIVPLSEKAAANVLQYEVYRQTPPLLKERIFLREESQGQLRRVIYITQLFPRSGLMKGVLIQEFDKQQLKRIISAKSGEWVNGEWWIDSGSVYELGPNGESKLLFKFDRQSLHLDLDPKEVEDASQDPSEMNLMQLYRAIQALSKQGADLTQLWVLFNLRIAVPWASVALALVGAALGSRPQRASSSVGLGISVVIIFIYYVILSLCQSLGEAALLPAIVAAWLPNVIFASLGTWMVWRAN